MKDTNKRINITVSKDTFDYLETITKIYNLEFSKLSYSEKKINYPYSNNKKLSISSLYQIAIGNLILQIDRVIDLKKSKEEVHKDIFDFLAGNKKA